MKKLLPSTSKASTLLLLSLMFIFQTGFSQTATFTTSGTWTCPAGVTSVNIECWGGGGAGGGSTVNQSAGAGGGGGAYNKGTLISVTPGTTYNIVVGTGGLGVSGAAGNAGSSSYFNINTAIANGGSGGNLNNGAGGAGGPAGVFSGGNGAAGGNSTSPGSGAGGGSAGSLGNGGNANGATGGTAGAGGGAIGAAGFTAYPNGSVTGNNGVAPGSGGGGGRKGNNGGAITAGGNGGDGQVIITWTCPDYNLLTSATTATTVCANTSSTVTLTSTSLTTGSYTVGYTLTGSNTGSSTSIMNFTAGSPGTGTFTTITLPNAGATTITINSISSGVSPNHCSSTITTNNTANITVNASPAQPTIVSGSTAVCVATTQTYSVTNIGGVSYTWNIPAAGWSIISGQGTNSVTYNVGVSGTVSVTPTSGGCAGPAQTWVVSVSGVSPGTYSVGPTGSYNSLTAVMTALGNACAISGTYTFELQSTYNSSVETFPISLPAPTWASATNTVTIRPASGASGLSISSSSSTGTLILNSSKYFIIDGRSGGTGSTQNLSIVNTSTSGYVVQFINDAQNNILGYCSVQGVNSSATSGNIIFSTSATTGGNSNNTIDYCDIRDGATTPANAIYSIGTAVAGQRNINNTISNSNLYNFFSTTLSSNGIYLGTGTTDWTITGNSFYQTSSRVLGSGNTWSAIQLNNTTAGNNISISGNFFGGTAPGAASGTMTFTGAGILNLIKMAGSTGTASSIQANTIRNISFTTSSGVTPHAFIRHLQGNINIGTVTGNTIGSQSATGNIIFSCSGTGELAGITAGINSAGSTDIININNNNIGGMSISGAGTVTFAGIKLRGLPGACTINNNIVGSTTTANSISNSTQEESNGIIAFVGSTTALQTISNNTIANIWMSNAATSSNHLYGINAKDATAGTAGGIYTISNNTVYKLISASKIPVGNYTTAGISLSARTQGGQTVSGNIIHSLHDTDPTAASGMVGIDYAGPVVGTNKVEKNYIHDLTIATNDVTGPSLGVIVGLNINNGVTTYSNNVISLGDSSGYPITKSYEIYGIGDYLGEVSTPLGAGYNNYLHNTVYIGGAGVTGATNKTFAYYNSVPDTRSRTIKNNIFYNARSGTGNHYAMYYPSNVTGVTNVTSDYNDLYVSGTGGKIAFLNGVSYDTITTWRAATSKDAMSVTDDPLLVNPAGSVTTKDLQIQTGSICNNEATPTTPVAITTDFAGTLRDVVHGSYPATPDIGAYELVRGTSPGTWIGIINTDWFNTANWDDGVVPTSSIHTYIARGHNDVAATQYFPVITSGGAAQCKNIILHLPTTNLTVTGTGEIKVAGIIKSGVNINKGKFDLVDGTLELNGTSGTQDIAGNMFFQTTIKHLTVSNDVNIINQWAPDTVRITGIASFGNVDSKTITTNNNLTLVSSATATAALADITNGGANSGNTVSGNVTVERFINAGRKWRYLSFPTSGQNFKQSWQEGATAVGQNPNPGFGMHITDNLSNWSSNGFDTISIGGPTIKTYNPASNGWDGVSNTTANVVSTKGYMTFVRGSRQYTPTNFTTSSTVLRNTGALYQGTQADITVPSGQFVGIGNPYPAAVDLRLLDKANTTDFFYVWDPKLSGSYSVGGFQLFSRSGANYVVTPGGGSYGTPGATSNYIESGQAFFIRGAGSTGTVTFKENAKAYGNSWMPYFTQVQSQDLRATLLIPAVDTLVADGVFVNYTNSHSNTVDHDDALKFGNANENVSIRKENKLLSVERRKEISGADTLFINTTGLRVQSYVWKFQLDNMDAPGRTGFLVDNYLNSSTPLNLSGTTEIYFNVVNVPASYAPDRFKVLWYDWSALPVSITALAASRNNNGSIAVQWKTENEVNIQEYQLERSADGRSFSNISNTAPKANNGSGALYAYPDNNPLATDNFYRVKAVSSNGQVQFSSVVKVAAQKSPASIKVYPNPVADKKMNVQFMQQPAGNYSLQLSNQQGQVIFQTLLKVTATVFANIIELPASISTGQYQLLITSASGEKSVQKIIIE